MTITVALVLTVAAGILGLVEVIEERGHSWAGWGVLLLAVALLLGNVKVG